MTEKENDRLLKEKEIEQELYKNRYKLYLWNR